MKTLVTRSLTALAAVSLVSACATGPTASSATGGQTATVTLGINVPNMGPGWIEVAVGKEKGFFAKEGINLDAKFLGSSGDVMQALAANRVNVGASTPELVFPAIAKGQGIKMVYNWERSPVQSLAVPSDSLYKGFGDMKGKTIGVSALSSGAKTLCDASLTDAGLDPKSDVNYLAVGVGVAAWDALRRGRVDALMLWDTEYAAMENAGAQLRYVRSAKAEPLFATTFVVGNEWVKKNPSLIAKFGRAWAKSSQWAGTHPDEAIKMMWKVYPQTKTNPDATKLLPDQLKVFKLRYDSVSSGEPGTKRNWGEYDAKGIEEWLAFAQSSKLITSPLDAKSVYSNEFVKSYNKFTDADL